jgi:hypothetical protein
MIIQSIKQLFDTFIVRISKMTKKRKLLTMDSNLVKQSERKFCITYYKYHYVKT